MRILNVYLRGRPALAVRHNKKLINLALAAPKLPRDLKGLLEMGADGLAQAKRAAAKAPKKAQLDENDVVHLPPLLNPSKILCLGVNYAAHAKEMKHSKPDFPVVFARHSNTLVGHGGGMVRPAASERFDYEGELVAFIGKTCRHAAIEDAHSYVAGYACFNDGSIRDWQRKSSQFTLGKNFDGTGGFGPEFVSADELPPGAHGLKITTKLNNKMVQNSNTRLMFFKVDEAIAIISTCMTLYPGDLIVMGTPGGVGAARTPPLWMKAGDTVAVEIEKLGKLVNPIVNEAPIQRERTNQTNAPAKAAAGKRAPKRR